MNIQEKLKLHKMWLNGEAGGVKADFSGADLRHSDFSGANLRHSFSGADLRHSNFSGADLRGAKNIMQFGPIPTSGRIIYAVRHDSIWMVQAGCFWGTLDELEKAVRVKHNCPVYLGIIELLRKI